MRKSPSFYGSVHKTVTQNETVYAITSTSLPIILAILRWGGNHINHDISRI